MISTFYINKLFNFYFTFYKIVTTHKFFTILKNIKKTKTKGIIPEGKYHLLKLDDNIINMFAHYHNSLETNVLDFITKKNKALGPFDPYYKVDQCKLLHGIQ